MQFSSKKFNNNFVVMSRCHAQQQGSVQVQVPPSQFVRTRSSRGGSSRHGSGNESNISDGLRNELIRPGPQRHANQPDLNRLQNRQVGPVQGLFIFISSIVVLMFYGRTNAVQYACLCLSLFFTKTRQVTGTSRWIALVNYVINCFIIAYRCNVFGNAIGQQCMCIIVYISNYIG